MLNPRIKITVFVTVFSVVCFCSNFVFSQKLPKGIEINSNPEAASIFIEGEVVGKSPLVFPYTLNGKYQIRAIKRGYDTWKKTIKFTSNGPASITIILKRKNRFKAAVRSIVWPGWGQLYSDKRIRGRLTQVVQWGLVGAIVYAEIDYRQKLDSYEDALQRYNQAKKSYLNKDYAWNEISKDYAKVDKAFKLKKTFIGAALGVYAFNVLDALLFFPQYYRPIKIVDNFNMKLDFSEGAPIVVTNISLNF